MPGDPNERHAEQCARLALPLSPPRETFDSIASTWMKLAVELEAHHALLDEWDKLEEGKRLHAGDLK